MSEIINHFRQNRAAHLAMRDLHYQYATAHLKVVEHDDGHGLNIAEYERILYCLREARKHGKLATREINPLQKDVEFYKFINLLVGNVKAILSILNMQASVEQEGGFVRSVLSDSGIESVVKPEGLDYRKRLKYLLNIVEVSSVVYEELRQLNRDEFSSLECDRYDKMMDTCKEECAKRHPPAGKKNPSIWS